MILFNTQNAIPNAKKTQVAICHSPVGADCKGKNEKHLEDAFAVALAFPLQATFYRALGVILMCIFGMNLSYKTKTRYNSYLKIESD